MKIVLISFRKFNEVFISLVVFYIIYYKEEMMSRVRVGGLNSRPGPTTLYLDK